MKPKEFREIREKLGLTQKELAEIFGLSGYAPISHYESGFRNPSTLIAALMRILDELPARNSSELRLALKTQILKLQNQKRRAR